ncbi:large conductance mechanosensitive channel protein MscL [Athalassotoga saccharophila]|uniref:large conductance mechanosensitive channel protein MscL n=1 Tax=Athalassotoga saccharophila TaxID=1441386 RepID=UPI00137ADAFB|nr:large conductance mechanosensitive channel protein MscL [Athalassotoga saccharophila]BBJ27701.1 large-conductance mechanosensitive channel [Athalassotoga saccharophila]
MLNDFRKFLSRGNVLDMAVGIIIGIAFGSVVSSLVNNIIMPPIGLLIGKVNFSDLFINLSNKHYSTLAAAKAAGAPTINYGVFVNTVINFLIIAFAVFLMITVIYKAQKKYQKSAAPAPVTTKKCPYCKTDIPIDAVRCPNCTSDLSNIEKKS